MYTLYIIAENKFSIELIAIIVTAIITITGHALVYSQTKRNRSAELITKQRHEWRDDLRKSMAEFILLARKLINVVRYEAAKEKDGLLPPEKNSRQLYDEMYGVSIYIRLLLNPYKEKENSPESLLLGYMNTMIERSQYFPNRDLDLQNHFKTLDNARNALLEAICKYLKEDWEQAKKEAK